MRKNTKLPLITNTIFAALIGGLSLWNVMAPKETVSWNENRTLAAFPSLSVSHIFGGSFDDDFERWFSDHFVHRDFWIELKSGLRRASLAIENNDIYYARNDRLVSRFASYNPSVLDANLETVDQFAKDCGTTANVLLVPTASWGARSELPFGASDIDQIPLLEYAKTKLAGQNVIDYTQYASPSPHLYFRTDHHWNEQGAYLGYAAIAKEVLHKEPERFQYEEASPSFTGTMYSKSGAFWTKGDPINRILPEKPVNAVITFDNGETIPSVFSEKRLAEKDKYMFYADGNHPYAKISTDVHNGRKAVIAKDSYSHILMPYLICEYEEITLIDLRYYHEPVSQLLDDSSDLYVIYSLDNFATDQSIAFLR